jgi:hypothetical protein
MGTNPYTLLRDHFRRWASGVVYPERRTMWVYPKARLDANVWSLLAVWERTAAAKQVGFEVVLFADDDGLHLQYVKERPRKLPI